MCLHVYFLILKGQSSLVVTYCDIDAQSLAVKSLLLIRIISVFKRLQTKLVTLCFCLKSEFLMYSSNYDIIVSQPTFSKSRHNHMYHNFIFSWHVCSVFLFIKFFLIYLQCFVFLRCVLDLRFICILCVDTWRAKSFLYPTTGRCWTWSSDWICRSWTQVAEQCL